MLSEAVSYQVKSPLEKAEQIHAGTGVPFMTRTAHG